MGLGVEPAWSVSFRRQHLPVKHAKTLAEAQALCRTIVNALAEKGIYGTAEFEADIAYQNFACSVSWYEAVPEERRDG